jgi:Fe-S-cluster-containing dehydrogenase component/CRP-like cAMP-binding protein
MSIVDQQVPVARPKRWDVPLDSQMSEAAVDKLLTISPFAEMDTDAFSRRVPLRGILKNDCRIKGYQKGDLVIRQGDYGNTAFLILDGELLVTLAPLPPDISGRQTVRRKSWLNTLARAWRSPRVAESRDRGGPRPSRTGTRTEGDETRVFLQDIPGTIDLKQTQILRAGMLFGELAALNRTPRSATVIANGHCALLEMRWQGFRDLMKRDPALREYVDRIYRQHSLGGHLRLTPELAGMSRQTMENLAAATVFQSFGEFEWHHNFRQQKREDIARRIEREPVIAEQGAPASDFIMIRNGFVRLSRRYGDGQRTVAYLGKGHTFGWREIVHHWQTGQPHGYSLSLRAIGHVDILKIPAETIRSLVLPQLDTGQLPPPLPAGETHADAAGGERRTADRNHEIDTGLLEFLVGQRFINGTQAMLIDLDRCTRCDDCVRACAAMHDNNPRFLRQGPRHDNWMIASACMHCADPVCMIGCPTGAIGRDEVTGHVIINDITCIGCGTCADSCPYQNIQMVEIRDRRGKPLVDEATRTPLQKATKCDFCVEQSGGPACQRACPHDALYRVDLTTPAALYQLTR